ncbi:unnamed protein product [Gongylonema pulchrum]|uniref:Thioredoxin domain-containing protein n=1 Tax=Gongylonema pulchrum TaxID=637853 RepID=A0A183EAM0_9BILA|nr:unnamed protein product [Gongylonema pulchrum]
MTGYHIGGIALSLAFLALKSTSGLCALIFTECGLDYEQIQRNPRITWMIFFYTAWSPDCRHVAPVFAELSDSGEANRFRINICPGSKQLPTVRSFLSGSF